MKKYEFIEIECPLCKAKLEWLKNCIGYEVVCPNCHKHFIMHDPVNNSDASQDNFDSKEIEQPIELYKCNEDFEKNIADIEIYHIEKIDNTQWFYKLFKQKVSENFISQGFLKKAKKKFDSEKWSLPHYCSIDFIEEFFLGYNYREIVSEQQLFQKLQKKLNATLNAQSNFIKLVGKLHLILAVIYIELKEKRIDIIESWIPKFAKVLVYFYDHDDLIPDTSQAGYLDDLYIFILGFKNMREPSIQKINRRLKEVLLNDDYLS